MISEVNFATLEVETVNKVEVDNNKPGFRTSAFKSIRRPLTNQARMNVEDPSFSIEQSDKIFSNVIVSLKIANSESMNLEARLAQLMKSPAIRAIVRASQDFAEEHGISEDSAMRTMLSSLKELDQIWDQILTKEGVQSLTTKRV